MSWLSDLFGGKEEKFSEYTPPDYTQLKNLLLGYQEKGFPEIMSESYWGEPWRQTGQDINEQFQAKKGMQAGTPEFTALQNARSGLMSNLIGQNVGVRQNALNMLGNITPRPTTQYTPESAGLLENLLGFGAPLASVGLQSYMQNQNPMNKAMTQYLTNQVTPQSPANIFSSDNNITKLFPYLLGMV